MKILKFRLRFLYNSAIIKFTYLEKIIHSYKRNHLKGVCAMQLNLKLLCPCWDPDFGFKKDEEATGDGAYSVGFVFI